jgi:fibrillarin-like rRNA methylase
VYAGFCKKQESANTHNNGENTETRAKEDDEEIDVKQINLQDATMKEKADKADALYKEEIDKLEEENKKISGYTKLQPYNKPVKLIVVATLGAIVNGSA